MGEMMRQTIWLERTAVATLKQIGVREDRPVGWLIRRAVQQFIERTQVTQVAQVAQVKGRYMRKPERKQTQQH